MFTSSCCNNKLLAHTAYHSSKWLVLAVVEDYQKLSLVFIFLELQIYPEPEPWDLCTASFAGHAKVPTFHSLVLQLQPLTS